ncbi:MAG: translation initiation factor IF-2 N-terminal domain-containing protein [Actinophytocola sp.]|uniref:translation initiation factor IF-2 N-terminal domain-containing protein n=1 Tax=Actinophytocola sp. TaxID=1872138 RepID=UPI003C7801C7
MTDMSTPAGNTGGDTTTPIAAALADLPARIRVHALAKLLGRSSREVLAAVTALGVDGRSVQSSIDRELALRVAESLGVTGADAADAEAAASAQAATRTEVPAGAPAQAPPAGGTQQSAPRIAGTPGFSEPAPVTESSQTTRATPPTPVFASASPLFLPPEPPAAPARQAVRPAAKPKDEPEPVEDESDETEDPNAEDNEDNEDDRPRRRRGRRGRGRGKGGQDDAAADEAAEDEPKPAAKQEKADKADRPAKRKAKEEPEADDSDDQEQDGEDAATRRRRRRRRRRGGADDESGNPTEDDPPNTVVHVREARDDKDKGESDGRDEVRSVRGSTRLEAKRQRRRDGREAGRRRAPILSEAEFLARREAVDRAMVVRERGDRIQIGVLEDGVLVEHFVTSSGTGSLVGNVYLGRVQNVLPSMEAAFVDIGRGRNAVLYAGEVDWDAAGLEGKARKIEQALSTGDSVLVQVTKDPVGHKGARLTTQISLPGRFLVYVPGGGATGISRKLPENERRRLKDVLKRVVPEDAGVIIRTASEGISEEELARDVRRLQAQWQVIKDRTEGTNGVRKVGSPSLVYEEPDLLVKVVRDLFTEDFSALVVQGGAAWETVDAYVRHVAPELADRVRKHASNADVFAEYRIEEQLLKALDRKVWLPSGGYLVIDRTEAMTVIDVNTGKFTGSGGNLEETVTRNNLESAEEIVRQLRLRDIGGIIVIDFIDMVLESNRDLVLRRLTECLGRDRTRHQVAEVTSLGLVQMTRKRVGTGLLEAFGTTCEYCKGRGVLVSTEPISKPGGGNGHTHAEPSRGSTRRSRGRGDEGKDKAQDKDKDKAQNKDAAKEAAAQAAKEAVRDIAKATKATVNESESAEPESAEPAAQPEPQPEAQTDETPHRSRHRSRSSRAEARAANRVKSADAAASRAETNGVHTGPAPAAGSEPGATEPTPATSEATEAADTPDGEAVTSGGEPGGPVADEQATRESAEPTQPESAVTGADSGPTQPAETTEDRAEPAADGLNAAQADTGSSESGERPYGRSNGSVDRVEPEVEPTVPAPSTPPRRQPRRAASRPAGPPVAVRRDG